MAILFEKPLNLYKYFAVEIYRFDKNYIMNKTSSFLLTVLAYLMLVSCSPRDRYVVIAGFAQGGTYSVKFNLKGEDGMVEKNVEEIRDSIDAILSRIDNSISGYNRKSLLSRFNSGQEVVPDRIFIDVFKK